MKKVALIIKSLRNGGAERVVSVLSHAFSTYYHVDIILFDARKIDYSYSGNIIDLKFYKYDNLFFKIFNFLKYPLKKQRLLSIKKQNHYDAVISFVSTPNKLNIDTKLPHENCIVTVHNYLSLTKNFSEKSIELLPLYNKANNIIAVSEGVKCDLMHSFHFKENAVQVIYNPINNVLPLESFDNTPYWSDWFQKYDVLINAGSLNDQKAQWNLIRSFSLVKQKCPSTKLIIFGRGKYESIYTEMIRELGLNDDIAMVGFRQDFFHFLAQSKIFLLSSSFEGFGNVIIESLSYGIPVVTTDCNSGPREIMAPETNIDKKTSALELTKYGYLTPLMHTEFTDAFFPISNQEILFAEGITHLLQDKNLYLSMRRHSLERAKDFFVDKIFESWKRII